MEKINLEKPKTPILLHVSNFRQVKQTLEVVKIFEDVQRQIPCQLIMIGDGPEKTNTIKYAKTKNLQVYFVGVKV